jgi:hypothetical protein
LQEEGSEERPHRTSHTSMPKPSPIHVSAVQNISPTLQLLEDIANVQYEFEALAENQVKF